MLRQPWNSWGDQALQSLTCALPRSRDQTEPALRYMPRVEMDGVGLDRSSTFEYRLPGGAIYVR